MPKHLGSEATSGATVDREINGSGKVQDFPETGAVNPRDAGFQFEILLATTIIVIVSGIIVWHRRPPASAPRNTSESTSPIKPVEAVQNAPLALEPASGKQLLWDYTREQEKLPEIPENVKEQLRAVIGPITGHESDMLFGPVLAGSFYPGEPSQSQTAYTVTLVWIVIDGRSHADGNWTFLIIATGDHFDSYDISHYGDSILRVFHPANSPTDLLLAEEAGGGQGNWGKDLRVLTVADHTLKLTADIGEAFYSDCAAYGQSGIVSDRVYYFGAQDGSITILPKKEFQRPCSSN